MFYFKRSMAKMADQWPTPKMTDDCSAVELNGYNMAVGNCEGGGLLFSITPPDGRPPVEVFFSDGDADDFARTLAMMRDLTTVKTSELSEQAARGRKAFDGVAPVKSAPPANPADRQVIKVAHFEGQRFAVACLSGEILHTLKVRPSLAGTAAEDAIAVARAVVEKARDNYEEADTGTGV